MVSKPPKLPVYDPTKGGDPFFWILETAKKVHEERRNAPAHQRKKINYLTGKPLK